MSSTSSWMLAYVPQPCTPSTHVPIVCSRRHRLLPPSTFHCYRFFSRAPQPPPSHPRAVAGSSTSTRNMVYLPLRHTTEKTFGPNHLPRPPLGPGPKSALVPDPTASRTTWGNRSLLSRLEPPTGTEGLTSVPIGGSNRDHWSEGTKGSLFCPGWWIQLGPKVFRTNGSG